MGFLSTIFGTGKNPTRTNKVNATVGSSQGGMNWAQMVADEPVSHSKFTVYDASGAPLELRETDQKAAGGEGTVYEFAKARDVTGKNSHKSISSPASAFNPTSKISARCSSVKPSKSFM